MHTDTAVQCMGVHICSMCSLCRKEEESLYHIFVHICNDIEFKISHIFREGNHCADKLTNLGLDNMKNFKWYIVMPLVINLDFFSSQISTSYVWESFTSWEVWSCIFCSWVWFGPHVFFVFFFFF
ncbi:hypothetical protein V8G54_007208 [Vigna mungo]|uniref:RNase H type-1 domain-containing protein n=1 Tax=Vigna mungo TaxID=3915 RepID=A0AAQ3P0K3_VIGMU